MGRKPLSSHPPEVAARMRADLAAKKRQAWAEGKYANRSNGALRQETQEKIAASVAQRWAEGAYVGRVDGMTNRRGSAHPGWTWGVPHYAEILAEYEPSECRACGSTENINAHHFDESHANYLLTNLAFYCVPCHLWRFHYDTKGAHVKRPVVSITKDVRFEYAHVLPWHPGKCARLHGHSGRLEATLSGRLDPNDTVVDFGDLGDALKLAVAKALDHELLNDLLPNPTSEALLVWAWRELESIGVKGLTAVTFSETSTSRATLTAAAMLDAFGWDHDDKDGAWRLVPKVVMS